MLLYVVFLAQEGWFMMSISFDLALVGLCLGHLLARGGEGAPLRFRRAAA